MHMEEHDILHAFSLYSNGGKSHNIEKGCIQTHSDYVHICTVYICLDIVYMGASCDFWLDDTGTYIMKCITINLSGYFNA